MRKRLLFVYNPNAGKRKIKDQLDDIITTFSDEDVEVVVNPTKKAGDATDIILEYDDDPNCYMIACSGGDGTLHEVVNGMMQRKNRVPIVYMPTGSTNDFGSSLSIPKDMVKAAGLAKSGRKFPCDVGSLDNEFFVYTACFGVFTETSYATPQNLKNSMGYFAYILNGATELTKIQRYKMKVEYDGRVVEDTFIFGNILSTSSIGGFKPVTPESVEFDDGLYEMLLIRDAKFYEFPLVANDILRGNYNNSEYLIYAKVNHVKFSCDTEVPWCLDGEFGGKSQTADIKIHHKAITLMVPDNNGKLTEAVEARHELIEDEAAFTARRIADFKEYSSRYDE